MSTATKSIKLTDVGPIAHLEIEVPEGGGVVEITGANGVGKSIVLEAVDALAGAKPEFSRRDGCDKSLVTGFGATLTLTRAASRRGRLDCIAIEGSDEVATLIDPGIKDPEKADARRIKALLILIAAEVGQDAFDALPGSEFIDWDSVDRADSVAMAASVKRQFQKVAREEEELAANKAGEFDFSRKAADGLDMDAESDAEKLQAALEDAIGHDAAMKTKVGAATDARDRLTISRTRLTEITESYEGPSVAAASEVFAAKCNIANAVKREMNALREELAASERKYADASREESAAIIDCNAAKEHERIVAELTQVIEADRPEMPSDEDVNCASDAVSTSRVAVERGALVRNANLKLADGQAAREAGEAHAATATQLRESADACDDVLSNAVSSDVLRVKDGRLVTKTERGDDTFLCELSQGERCRIALDIVVARARGTSLEGRVLLTVPQEFWEGLDDDNQAGVARLATERNVLIFAPRATSGPIRAEAFAAV